MPRACNHFYPDVGGPALPCICLHAPAVRCSFDSLRSTGKYDAFKAYGVSKLANILFARALNERLKGAACVPVTLSQPGRPSREVAGAMQLVTARAPCTNTPPIACYASPPPRLHAACWLLRAGQPVVAVSHHPGVIFGTGLGRHLNRSRLALSVMAMLTRPLVKSCPAGAATQVGRRPRAWLLAGGGAAGARGEGREEREGVVVEGLQPRPYGPRGRILGQTPSK